jgi:hypothetical protein
MLARKPATSSEQTDVGRYLKHILGVTPQIKPWEATGKLPYFLQDAYELRELRLLEHRYLLAGNRRKAASPPRRLRDQLSKLEEATGLPAVFVTHALRSYERKHLIDQKVPFIVPGNQLYLPTVGLDLREYFRQSPASGFESLSPATQALLISALLRDPWEADWQPGPVIAALGYTAMTGSRAIRELRAAGVATVRQEGRTRVLHMDRAPADIWQQVKPMMSTPVKRTKWVRLPVKMRKLYPLAGLSALARYSNMVEPTVPVQALSAAQWKIAKAADLEVLAAPNDEACEWQIWSYAPILVPNNNVVDPLSLWLSLHGASDDRAQLALDELEKRLPW